MTVRRGRRHRYFPEPICRRACRAAFGENLTGGWSRRRRARAGHCDRKPAHGRRFGIAQTVAPSGCGGRPGGRSGGSVHGQMGSRRPLARSFHPAGMANGFSRLLVETTDGIDAAESVPITIGGLLRRDLRPPERMCFDAHNCAESSSSVTRLMSASSATPRTPGKSESLLTFALHCGLVKAPANHSNGLEGRRAVVCGDR